jgi:hypothetical protein
MGLAGMSNRIQPQPVGGTDNMIAVAAAGIRLR